MRYDVVIAGGGLAGLTCGIRLQKAGKRCAIVSTGQNAMHFFSGAFGLISRLPDGKIIESPEDALESLGKDHPYSKIGKSAFRSYAEEARALLGDCGLTVIGDSSRNGYTMTASGTLKPAWLVLEDFPYFPDTEPELGKVLIVGISDFLDFNSDFIATFLSSYGTKCNVRLIATSDTEVLRHSPSEMRSTNIAKLMDRPQCRKTFIDKVKVLSQGYDTVILPAVFGLSDNYAFKQIRDGLGGIKVIFVGTLPPSVPGIRSQMQLKRAFEATGGTFLMGDSVISSMIDGDRIVNVTTGNFPDIPIEAESYVLATGSYFGHGLVAGKDSIEEPVFGSDVKYSTDRNDWYDRDFFARQPYMGYGVVTDSNFMVSKGGQTIGNLYAVGSVLGGCNPLYEGSGGGIALLTALKVSDTILKKYRRND